MEVELVDLSPAVKIRPVQQLWLPQREIFYQHDMATSSDPNGYDSKRLEFLEVGDRNYLGVAQVASSMTQEVQLTNIRLNEVPNTITIVGELHPDSETRFDFVEFLKPFIRKISITVAETPEVTSQFPSELLFRFFKENTLSPMTYEQWTNNCIVCISPQQIGIPNFSEGLALVTAINIKLTLELSPMAKRLRRNWDSLNYTGTTGAPHDTPAAQIVSNRYARVAGSPVYRIRTHFNFDNRSLLCNARREMLQRKNARPFKGGLELERKGRAVEQGLNSYV